MAESQVAARQSASWRRPRPGRIISSSDVGTVNRGQVLQMLLSSGPTSRAALARLMDVPRATITAIITPMIKDGTIIEGEATPMNGMGKPSRPLWFSPETGSCAAITFTTTELIMAHVNARGDIDARATYLLPARRRGASLQKWITTKITRAFAGTHGITNAGVTLAALCDPRTGTVLTCAPQPALEGVNLHDAVWDALAVPCAVDQDVRGLAAAERWFGSRNDVPDFAIVEVGVGVGAGIILNGMLHRGAHGPASHICVDIHGDPCACGLTGCWETIASTDWIDRQAELRKIPGSSTIAALSARSEAGDDQAAALLADYADNIAVGLSTLFQILGLPLFVLSGTVAAGGEALRRAIGERVHARISDHGQGPQVELSLLGEDASLYGSAAVALNASLGLTL